MEQQLDLFEDDLHCEVCNRPLPANSKGTICTFCAEQMLFSEVKDYIRDGIRCCSTFRYSDSAGETMDPRGTDRV